MGGGSGTGFNSSLAAAIARPSGSASPAPSAAPPTRKLRRRIMSSPQFPRTMCCTPSANQPAGDLPCSNRPSRMGVKRPGTREMTAMLAGLMPLNAFAIDAMVPALPQIGHSLHGARENDRQLVVIAYFVGFASTQLL